MRKSLFPELNHPQPQYSSVFYSYDNPASPPDIFPEFKSQYRITFQVYTQVSFKTDKGKNLTGSLKDKCFLIKGKLSVTDFFEMQYSLNDSIFISYLIS